jgi:hypothetical protein
MLDLETISLGTAPMSGDGDKPRVGGQKINANFAKIEAYLSATPATPEAVTAAWSARKIVLTPKGVTHKLTCNPSAGDDLRAMAEWCAASGHYAEEGGTRHLR